ncbi:ABC transporter permease [Spirochaeta dissipatitropha]
MINQVLSSMFVLAARNISRSMSRLRPMIIIIALSFALLLIGNAVLAYSSASFYRVYSRNLTADMSVSSLSEFGSFSLFGSDAFLVGEFLVPPTIIDYARLHADVNALPEVQSAAGVVSSAARLELNGRRMNNALFGVDFAEYLELFPELGIVAGAAPAPGEAGIMLQESHYENFRSPPLGSPVLLTVARDNTFTIREATLTGVYRYPVVDELLSRVSLIDVQTARALSGYIYGALSPADLPEAHRDLAGADIDDLFGGGGDLFGDDDLFGEEDFFGDEDLFGSADSFGGGDFFDEPELWDISGPVDDSVMLAQQTIDGAWNHLLIRLNEPSDFRRVSSELRNQGYGPQNDFIIRNWRDTAGGTAVIVWYLQFMLNAGLLFVAFGAVIVAANALMLSVLERQKEIGTMRALGASRARVSALIIAETLFVIAGAAALGVLIGVASVWLLNRAGIRIDNQYFDFLFGGSAMQAELGTAMILEHLAAALGFALLAALYPLKRALSIGPARAMS